MAHHLSLAERCPRSLDLDIWIRSERLEGGRDGVQMHNTGWRYRYGRYWLAGTANGEVGVSCDGDSSSGADRVRSRLMRRVQGLRSV